MEKFFFGESEGYFSNVIRIRFKRLLVQGEIIREEYEQIELSMRYNIKF